MLKVQNMKKVFEKNKSQIVLSKSEKHLLNLLNVKLIYNYILECQKLPITGN